MESSVIGFNANEKLFARCLESWKIRKSGVDVINIHYSGSFGPFGIGLLPLKFSKVKIITSFHGPWHLEAKSAGKSNLRVLIAYLTQQSVTRMSHSVIAMSDSFASIARKFFKREIFVYPPGINLDAYHPNHPCLKLRNFQIQICVVRRLVPRMGIDSAIKALSILPEKYILLIIGKGPEKDNLIKLTFELKLTHRVKFLGHVSDLELKRILLESDLMLVPTKELEGYGIVVLEAYANCLPVIATPVQGLLEAIPSQFHSWALTEDTSHQAIADKILNLRPENIPTHSTLHSILSRNSWKLISDNIVKIYGKR